MIAIWLPLMGLGMIWFTDQPKRTFWVSIVGVVLWLCEIGLATAIK